MTLFDKVPASYDKVFPVGRYGNVLGFSKRGEHVVSFFLVDQDLFQRDHPTYCNFSTAAPGVDVIFLSALSFAVSSCVRF